MAPSVVQTANEAIPTPSNTEVLPISILSTAQDYDSIKSLWQKCVQNGDKEVSHMMRAAKALRYGDIPVGFPTETVYGLGADATRSAAVRGIYQAKKRPLDNPLIVHFSNLEMLYKYLHTKDDGLDGKEEDLISRIYKPLIEKFWPGPLTILLPNPSPSPFASEVTTTLPTFGARMPSSPIARLLIDLAGTPLAAPSANASGLPSPTTAQHVESDLSGRIEIILDGGPCGVGLESTVVDGLSDPPAVLRPGGVGIDEIRSVAGWENTKIGYRDVKGEGAEAPRAPGMKYRHYAPKAQCVLFEAGDIHEGDLKAQLEQLYVPKDEKLSIGVIRTRRWEHNLGLKRVQTNGKGVAENGEHPASTFAPSPFTPNLHSCSLADGRVVSLWDVDLGSDLQNIAKGLFSALRSLDERGVGIIYIEGISDEEGDLAAAIMNRLRKACAG